MTFKSSPDIPQLRFPPPDDVPIHKVLLEDSFDRHPTAHSRSLYRCGLSGRSYSVSEMHKRVEAVASAMAQICSWNPNQGSQWDKVVAVFAYNSVIAWATHRLSGIVTPANAAYVTSELLNQLEKTRARVLFTCAALLPVALDAAHGAGIPDDRIFLLEIAGEDHSVVSETIKLRTISDLVLLGQASPPLDALTWSPGQGKWQLAYICFSSGTSGLPKGVMISHRNVIANVFQLGVFERMQRTPGATEVALGLLPQSHIYALVVICHACLFRGDEVVILPRYDLHAMCRAVAKYSINTLFLVPPILLDFLRRHRELGEYDLSCVTNLMTGAASFGATETTTLRKLFPRGILRQGYGLTESSAVVSSLPRFDPFPGSSGLLLPDVECKIVDENGEEHTERGQAGEVWIRSPSVALGYLDNEKATQETFGDKWLRTGDKGEFRLSPKGYEHLFIVDRIKDLIKVKGMQVAPAELESHILGNPAVADVAVVAVKNDRDGEVPKAFVVKRTTASMTDADLVAEIHQSIRAHKAKYKWLRGGIELCESIPKSPSGKILRRVLEEAGKTAFKGKTKGAKL
ncbi:acyl-CoA synthetase [Dactylonectria macrodidyma]|uniref:Acyl-CoA synthetase n=1 Tax=Dactylonectria macrodidyma TaxID=307937 RepID=A0A9P9IQB7_9HYPO|nr:acyl-CoA synthetase [Dactylonectria macrodidyma]